VTDILGYVDTEVALRKLDNDEKLTRKTYSSGQNRNMLFVNESGLYSLILKSRKPQAKQFKKWITAEVLPSIRKHGAYMTPTLISDIANNPDLLIELATKLKEEQEAKRKAEEEKRIAELEKQVAEEKVDKLVHTKKTYTTTEIAKELGFKSARALNSKLKEDGVQFKQNGTWVLKSEFANNGYMETKQIELENGKIIYNSHWTGEGRLFLLNRYK
jgi:prophage antirepressor-like protein